MHGSSAIFIFDRARIRRYFGNDNKRIVSQLGIRDSLDKRGVAFETMKSSLGISVQELNIQ